MNTPMKLLCTAIATAIGIVVIDAVVERRDTSPRQGPVPVTVKSRRSSTSSPATRNPPPVVMEPVTTRDRTVLENAPDFGARHEAARKELGRLSDERDAARRALLEAEREGTPARIDAAHERYRDATDRYEKARTQLYQIR